MGKSSLDTSRRRAAPSVDGLPRRCPGAANWAAAAELGGRLSSAAARCAGGEAGLGHMRGGSASALKGVGMPLAWHAAKVAAAAAAMLALAALASRGRWAWPGLRLGWSGLGRAHGLGPVR
jgi:hypothetical protein